MPCLGAGFMGMLRSSSRNERHNSSHGRQPVEIVHDEIQSRRDDTRQIRPCVARLGLDLGMNALSHGLPPVARVVLPLRGWVEQYAPLCPRSSSTEKEQNERA